MTFFRFLVLNRQTHGTWKGQYSPDKLPSLRDATKKACLESVALRSDDVTKAVPTDGESRTLRVLVMPTHGLLLSYRNNTTWIFESILMAFNTNPVKFSLYKKLLTTPVHERKANTSPTWVAQLIEKYFGNEHTAPTWFHFIDGSSHFEVIPLSSQNGTSARAQPRTSKTAKRSSCGAMEGRVICYPRRKLLV